MKARNTNRRRGAALLQTALSLALLAVFLGSALVAANGSRQSYRSASVQVDLGRATRDTVEEVVERLRPADLGAVFPAAAPGTWTEFVDFQRFDPPGAAQPSPPESFVLESEPDDPEDGVDNDGDGLIDEHQLVWIESRGTPQERTRVLTRHVAPTLEGEIPWNLIDDNENGLIDEPGACFEFQEGRIVFHLTLERLGTQTAPVVRTVRRTVALRNTGSTGQ